MDRIIFLDVLQPQHLYASPVVHLVPTWTPLLSLAGMFLHSKNHVLFPQLHRYIVPQSLSEEDTAIDLETMRIQNLGH